VQYPKVYTAVSQQYRYPQPVWFTPQFCATYISLTVYEKKTRPYRDPETSRDVMRHPEASIYRDHRNVFMVFGVVQTRKR